MGPSSAELAERLGLRPTTVKTPVGRILSKLDLCDRVQVVILAYETDLVSPRGGDSWPRSPVGVEHP
jgi:DNA-binding NarL/FixJ family response regulator